MDTNKPIAQMSFAEIEDRAQRLRAEAMRHGFKTAYAWITGRFTVLMHRAAH